MINRKTGHEIHPVSAVIHYRVAWEAKKFSGGCGSVLDIGGTGKMKMFMGDDCDVKDANIIDGIDGTDLPYEDGAFDVAVSVATLEHMEDQVGQEKFISEAVRVCRKASVHFFPHGEYAQITEKHKNSFPKYSHPCVWGNHINNFLSRKDQWCLWKTRQYVFTTVREHMALLCTMHPQMNVMSSYDLIQEIGDKPYGKILVIEKGE